MNNCLNCGKPVKNKYCNYKCEKQHKWKTFKVKCYKCKKNFEIKEYNVDKPKKNKYYCSRSCANSHIRTQESKLKISKTIKKLIENGNAPGFLSSEYINKNRNPKLNKIKMCPICNEEFMVRPSEYNKIYCSKKCYLNDKKCKFRKNSKGGIRIGSGRGKSGWYKGYWSDSSWELSWIIYHIEHNISFERNYKGFEYVFNNKIHKFYPDFKIDNGYIEIKGYIDEKNKCKINQFKGKLKIIDKKNITPYIEYVIKKYGKNFIELYENNPHRSKNNKCLVCGNDCVNLYCSRSCSGKRLR